MKKSFFVTAFSLLALCSCQKVQTISEPNIDSSSSNYNENSSLDSQYVSTSSLSSSEEEKASSFEALSMIVESGQKINYYLYTPKNIKENSSLILYLHGGSGKPTTAAEDLSLLTNEDGLPKFVKEKQISPDSYILFPQLPNGKNGWSDIKTDLYSFINKASTELKCDKTIISITGHSMGGKGTWDIALFYPDLFYNVAPLSGNVTTNQVNLNKLKDRPGWAFVGTEDTIVNTQSSIDFINSLKEKNQQAKITIIEGYSHFDVPYVYLSEDYNFLSWLVA